MSIKKDFKQLQKKSIKFVKKEALKVLKKDNDLVEFVMAMGGFFFINKKGDIVSSDDKGGKHFKKLSNFFYDWDNTLKMSGDPMRFRKDGKITTKW